MAKTALDDISFDGLGLLMFLIREKDKNNIVNIGYREIARRIGKGEHWVRLMIKNFTKKKIVKISNDATSDATSDARKSAIIVLFSIIKDAQTDAQTDASISFEDIWKKYNKHGTKKVAKSRFDRLSKENKEKLEKSIPYYMAFCEPSYHVYLEKYISNEYWNRVEVFDGVPIPKDNYRVADVGKFLVWFNKKVAGSGIPQISELTPQRQRMLNICYTLCEDEMKKVMNILLNNEKYVEMANKGMIDFDYIFKPVNLRRICEKGGNDD